MNRTSPLLRAAMLLALALPLPLTAQAQRSRRVRDAESRSVVDTTVAFDRNGTVSVTIPDGDIEVTGWTRNEIRVHATSEDGGVRFSASPLRVTVEPDDFRRSSDYRIQLSVPVGTRVSARALSGEVTIRGSKGDVEVNAQSGDVRLEDVAGRIDVTTLSGNVDVSGIAGNAEIRSVSGDVTLASITGDVEIETVSGEIEIDGARATLVRAHTTSGDVRYAGTIDPKGRYELATHSGDLHLTVPQSIGAQIGIATWSGTVESDFPMTLKPGEHGIGSGSAKRFSFEVGNGSSRVTLESFSGDITISSRSSTRP